MNKILKDVQLDIGNMKHGYLDSFKFQEMFKMLKIRSPGKNIIKVGNGASSIGGIQKCEA